MGLKPVIAVIFVFLYGVALVKPALPLVEYYIKMDVYLEQCTNKKRPELHCDGQCILMQKLKAFNGETQTPAPPVPAKINLQEYPIGFVEKENLQILIPFHAVPESNGFLLSSTDEFFPEIFHPPSTGQAYLLPYQL